MPAMEADRGFAFGIFQTRGEFYSDVSPQGDRPHAGVPRCSTEGRGRGPLVSPGC